MGRGILTQRSWAGRVGGRAASSWKRYGAPVRIANLTVKRVVALLTFIMGLAALYHFYTPIFSGPPAKRAMTGDLNVAIAGFTAARGTSHSDASGLSDSLYRAVRDELEVSGSDKTPLQIQVAGPGIVGTIKDRSRSERASEASRLDSQLKADVMLYGIVKTLPDGIEVTPEFYFAPRTVTHPEDREAMLTAVSLPPTPSGQQSLGTIREAGAFAAAPAARARLRNRLVQRARAFTLFIVGLGYYTDALQQRARGLNSRAAFLQAQRSFRAAEATREWDPRVAHVLYLFLGNVALAQHHWVEADRYYTIALRSQPGYLRAQFGLAEAQFHRWSGECSVETTNVAALVRARDGYNSVLRQLGATPSVLRSKAQFGLGRAALCLGAAGKEDQFALAESQFRAVVADYARKTWGITAQVAGAYGGLGLIVLLRGNSDPSQLRAAESSFQQAIALTPAGPVRGSLYSFLANVRAQLGERAAAAADFGKAMQLDPANKAAYQQEETDVLGR